MHDGSNAAHQIGYWLCLDKGHGQQIIKNLKTGGLNEPQLYRPTRSFANN